jgi:4-hydroxybenzoyl-CoA thioesterase
MYERTWTVRFSDTDPFGIAHYPRIVDAIHETSDMFVQKLGFPFWEISQEQGFGLPVVSLQFEFENAVEAGDEVTIRLRPEVSERTVEFVYEARCDGDVAFSGRETRVCARTDGGGAMQLPDDFREALAAHADE